MSSITLQLQVEIEMHGLYDMNKPHDCSENKANSVKLDELRRYQDAWLNLRFAGPIKRNLGEDSMFELREEHYVVASSSADNTQLDSLKIIPLCSLDHPAPTIFQTNFQDFTVDFGQDLAVLANNNPHDTSSLEIRLASIKSGLAHPLAHRPIFHIQVGFEISGVDDPSFSLEVMGDILVTQVEGTNQQGYEILTWNWKTCTLLARIGSECGMGSFTFLDSSHLAVFSSGQDESNNKSYLCRVAISLYPLYIQSPDNYSGHTVFHVSQYTRTYPSLTFEFPELADSYQLSPHGILRSDPVPGRALRVMDNTFAYPSAQTLTLTFTLFTLSGSWLDDDAIHLRIFISANHLRCYLTDHAGKIDTTHIAWDEWGTHSTRWFLCDQVTNYWVFWMFASRFVLVNEDPYSPLHDLTIFDFNPQAAIRHERGKPNTIIEVQSTPERQEEMNRITLEGRGLITPHIPNPIQGQDPHLLSDNIDSSIPTVIKGGFSSPVESRLPYRVVSRPQFVPSCLDWSIDENHIVGRSPNHGSMEEILVYSLQI